MKLIPLGSQEKLIEKEGKNKAVHSFVIANSTSVVQSCCAHEVTMSMLMNISHEHGPDLPHEHAPGAFMYMLLVQLRPCSIYNGLYICCRIYLSPVFLGPD